MKHLKELLEIEHSKRNTIAIAQKVIAGEISTETLVQLIKNNEELYAQRAAWIIHTISDEYPTFFQSYIFDLVECLTPAHHDAVHRCIWRCLSRLNLPEEIQGTLFEDGLKKLISKKTAVAIKVWIMDTLFLIVEVYPELKDELRFAIGDQLDHASAAFKSRGNRILKKLDKLQF